MTLYAAIVGVGILSFISLYACFSISEKRIIEKGILYAMGLTSMLTIPFILYADSLEANSILAPLTSFFEKYFIIMLFFFVGIISIFFLHILTTQLGNLAGEKDE